MRIKCCDACWKSQSRRWRLGELPLSGPALLTAILARRLRCGSALHDRPSAHIAAPGCRLGTPGAPRRCNPTNGDRPQRHPSAEGRQASEKVSTFASTFFQSAGKYTFNSVAWIGYSIDHDTITLIPATPSLSASPLRRRAPTLRIAIAPVSAPDAHATGCASGERGGNFGGNSPQAA